MCKKFFLICLFVSCCVAVVPQEQLTNKYLSIRDRLTDLKKNSELVTEQLSETLSDLKMSQAEAQKWEQTSIRLSENLTTINKQLNESYLTIKLYQKLLTSLISIFAGLLLIKAIFIILYKLGFKVPRIVDILA